MTETDYCLLYDIASKRVEELETENSKLLDVINNQDIKIADLQHKVGTLQGFLDHDIEYDMDKAIQNLKKENAELKTDYEVLSCSVGDWEELQEKYEKEQRENNGLSDQLVQAKEIIRELLSWERRADYDYSEYDLIKDRAEQFLKEINK